MFGLSFWEIALILGIALIVLGPSQLPQLARTFGKSLREFRKATDEFRNTINDETFREDPPAPKPVIPARTAPVVDQPVVVKAADTIVEAEPAVAHVAPSAPAAAAPLSTEAPKTNA